MLWIQATGKKYQMWIDRKPFIIK